MIRQKYFIAYVQWLVLFFLSFLSTSFAQPKQCFFKYAAYPDKAKGGKLAYGAPGMEIHITKMDYSSPDKISFVFDYGSGSENLETYKRVTTGAFNNEPKEIRGHKLLGAYFNSNVSLYMLYYLAPNRTSMLVKEFAQPGKLFFYWYFSDTRTNPFEDMVLPFSLNDSIQLKPSPLRALRKAPGK